MYRSLFSLAALLLISGCPRKAAGPEDVVLLHGLGRSSSSMRVLEECLLEHGYRVTTWDYASLDESIGSLGDKLYRELDVRSHASGVHRIHVVTHSMGGVVARKALTGKAGAPKRVGRIVMLAPPNRGSWMAGFLAPLVGDVIPAIGDLSDESKSAVNAIPPLDEDIEVGIIAARFDPKAPVSTTYLDGARDHIVVPASHSFIMDRRDVCFLTVSFLRKGRFPLP